ncbi:ankyrin repeat-containing domain protein, partial [Polychytrium aggregatum]|uniref:ankyrin repeat-containing domain protein n=1 Tax=Polychytrium aggregatum TaxID=110093 RepID=UPI0022FDF66A
LLDFGAWVNCVDSLGLTPLWYAVAGSHLESVQKLLAAKADTEIFDDNGKGLLHQACLNDTGSIAGLLIDYGANIEATNSAGNTPLHVACSRNSRECARWLLMRGADRTKVNKSSQTP